jgi:hypothetical protein
MKKLFEDDSYELIQTLGPFGISWPVLCSYSVVNKTLGQSLKLTGNEKSYLLATLQHYVQHGGNPKELKQLGLFLDLCQAVTNRGGVLWQFFFQSENPATRARSLLMLSEAQKYDDNRR